MGDRGRLMQGDIATNNQGAHTAKAAQINNDFLSGQASKVDDYYFGKKSERNSSALPSMDTSREGGIANAPVDSTVTREGGAIGRSEDRLAATKANAEATRKKIKEVNDLIAKKSAEEPDPSRWWNKKSTGERALLRVALALGAFGASLTKRKNDAMAIMQAAIDRDVKAQGFRIKNELASLQGQKVDAYKDVDIQKRVNDAELLHEQVLWGGFAAQMKASADRNAGTVKGHMAMAAYEGAKAQQQYRLATALGTTKSSSWSSRTNPALGKAMASIGAQPKYEKTSDEAMKHTANFKTLLNRTANILGLHDQTGKLSVISQFMRFGGDSAKSAQLRAALADAGIMMAAAIQSRPTNKESAAKIRVLANAIDTPAAARHFVYQILKDSRDAAKTYHGLSAAKHPSFSSAWWKNYQSATRFMNLVGSQRRRLVGKGEPVDNAGIYGQAVDGRQGLSARAFQRKK